MKDFLTTEQVARIKEQYPKGTVIELEDMYEEVNPVPSGTCGIVMGVDDAGQILMNWNNGRTLSLIANKDSFKVIPNNTVTEQQFEGTIAVLIAKDEVDTGIKLFLPNSYEKIIEACEKANQNPEDCYVYDSYTKTGTVLLHSEQTQHINLFELNFLAVKLQDLDEIEMFGFDGMIEHLEEPQDLPSLINIAMNCKDMQGVSAYPATTDEELGEFYIDMESIEEVNRMPYEFREWVIRYLDAQRIGKDIREKENGFFTENAYISLNIDELLDLYDGDIRMPEQEEIEVYTTSQGMSY